MVQITYTLRLDMRDTGIVNTSLRLKQGDSGMKIAVNVFNGGVSAFDSSTTPKIVFRRPDGASVMADMTVESSLYSYTLVGNELQVPGKELIDIKFPIGAEGRESTMSCSIEVVPDTITPNTHGSGIYDNDLAELVEEATEAAETVQEVVGDSEAWADGTRGGVPVGPEDPAYHNNSKYWSEQANPTRLENLTDVDLENLTDGDILRYNSGSSKWENSDALTDAESDIDDIDDEISAICNVYGSKNLLPYPYKTSSYSNRGVDFTSNANGSILINGSNDNTSNSIYQLHGAWASTTLILPAGKYIISTGTDNSDIAISVCYNDTILGRITGEGEVNAPNGVSYITCEVAKGKSVSNVTAYPMITDARIKDRTYVPYVPTNRDCMSYAVNTKLGAHNLAPFNPWVGTINGTTLTNVGNGTVRLNATSTTGIAWFNIVAPTSNPSAASDYVTTLKKGSYKLVVNSNQALSSNVQVGFFSPTAVQIIPSLTSGTHNEVTFTLSADTPIFLGVRVASGGISVTNFDIQAFIILADDTDTTYAPHAMTNGELTNTLKSLFLPAYMANGATYAGNCNDLEPGLVYVGSGAANSPGNYYLVFTFSVDLHEGKITGYGTQIGIGITTQNIKTRICNSGTWSAWKTITPT